MTRVVILQKTDKWHTDKGVGTIRGNYGPRMYRNSNNVKSHKHSFPKELSIDIFAIKDDFPLTVFVDGLKDDIFRPFHAFLYLFLQKWLEKA